MRPLLKRRSDDAGPADAADARGGTRVRDDGSADTREMAAIDAPPSSPPATPAAGPTAPVALRGVDGTLVAPWDRTRWTDALRPHLEADDPRVAGRARAALWDSNRMAMRVFEAWRDLSAEADERSRNGSGAPDIVR